MITSIPYGIILLTDGWPSTRIETKFLSVTLIFIDVRLATGTPPSAHPRRPRILGHPVPCGAAAQRNPIGAVAPTQGPGRSLRPACSNGSRRRSSSPPPASASAPGRHGAAAYREAERDLGRLVGLGTGQLRIAVECDTCFDWLMPSMDAFRERWPEVELDIVSASTPTRSACCTGPAPSWPSSPTSTRTRPALSFTRSSTSRSWPCCPEPRLPGQALPGSDRLCPPPDHLGARRYARPGAPGPAPGPREPPRRTTELTVAMLQLVASGRGWRPCRCGSGMLSGPRLCGAPAYRGGGLTGRLYAVTPRALPATPIWRTSCGSCAETSLLSFPGVKLL